MAIPDVVATAGLDDRLRRVPDCWPAYLWKPSDRGQLCHFLSRSPKGAAAAISARPRGEGNQREASSAREERPSPAPTPKGYKHGPKSRAPAPPRSDEKAARATDTLRGWGTQIARELARPPHS